MVFFTSLVAALIVPFALSAPNPTNSWGTGGGPPSGYYSVENFCSAPFFLRCCNGVVVAGVAGQDTSTQTGCTENPMAGGQVTYQFGYCPYNFRPFCCAAAVVSGVATGCGPPTQVYEPSH